MIDLRFFGCIIILLCLSLLAGCTIGMRELRQHLLELIGKDEVVVVIYGDNLASRGNIGDPESSWGEGLKPQLAKLFNTTVSVLNTGRRDNTFQYGYRNLQESVLSFRPDITFIMLGTLDAYSPGFLETTVKKDLDRFFSLLERGAGKVIVITSPGLGLYHDEKDERKARLDEYNDLLRESAQYHKFVVFNLAFETERILAANPQEYRSLFNRPDELSAKGNKFVASYIYQKLKEVMGVPSEN